VGLRTWRQSIHRCCGVRLIGAPLDLQSQGVHVIHWSAVFTRRQVLRNINALPNLQQRPM
jgi:hypothetical protein